MTAFLGSCVIRDQHWLSPVLDNSLTRRIGAVSYGIYLYHLFGMHLASLLLSRSHLAFPYDVFIVTMLVTWAIAELSYRFYEQPFLRLKESLSRRGTRAVTTIPSSHSSEPVAEVAPGG
jgi:peptidoglycan/LPS O-acetylase OafA/YrhL